MSDQFKYFKDEYIDAIRDNYMIPVFDRVLADPRCPRGAVLDVGCGNGLFGRYFKAKTACRLTGIDASPHALRQAQEAGYDAALLCRDFSADALPVKDKTADLILCKDVLEHLLDPLALLAEMRRALKDNGRLLCLVPNHFTIFGRLKFLFTHNIDTYGFFPGANEWDFPHVRFYTKAGYLAMMRQARFELETDFSPLFLHQVPKIRRLPGYSLLGRVANYVFPSSVATAFVGTFKKIGA